MLFGKLKVIIQDVAVLIDRVIARMMRMNHHTNPKFIQYNVLNAEVAEQCMS